MNDNNILDFLDTANIKNYFDAYLEDENNNLLEIGKACISIKDKSVDFVNEFVPLLEYKSHAKIIKLIDGEECHCFEGKVFLSSKTRLQLLEVNDSFITDKELHILQKVNIKASVKSSLSKFTLNPPIDIDIFSISMDKVSFTVEKQNQLKHNLSLKSNDTLKLKNVSLNVYRQLEFSDKKTVYYATIEKINENDKEQLVEYLSSRLILFP